MVDVKLFGLVHHWRLELNSVTAIGKVPLDPRPCFLYVTAQEMPALP